MSPYNVQCVGWRVISITFQLSRRLPPPHQHHYQGRREMALIVPIIVAVMISTIHTSKFRLGEICIFFLNDLMTGLITSLLEYTGAGVLVFHEQSVFFSSQPSKQPITFLKFLWRHDFVQDKLDPRQVGRRNPGLVYWLLGIIAQKFEKLKKNSKSIKNPGIIL